MKCLSFEGTTYTIGVAIVNEKCEILANEKRALAIYKKVNDLCLKSPIL